jgi:hypothetical protein
MTTQLQRELCDILCELEVTCRSSLACARESNVEVCSLQGLSSANGR